MKAQAMIANPVSDKAAHLQVSWAGGLARSRTSQSHLTPREADPAAAGKASGAQVAE